MIKRLELKEEKQKKEKKQKLILVIILSFIMLGSIFGIVVNSFGTSNNSGKIKYKNYVFELKDNYYFVLINGAKFLFSEHPKSVGEMDLPINIKKNLYNYYNKSLYIYSEDSLLENELKRNLGLYAYPIKEACLENEECNIFNATTKTCNDNFIYIKNSDENLIYEKENCVFIQGKNEDLLKLTDKFLFQVLGIN